MNLDSFYQFGQLCGNEYLPNNRQSSYVLLQKSKWLNYNLGISNESLVHFVAKCELALMSSYFETSWNLKKKKPDLNINLHISVSTHCCDLKFGTWFPPKIVYHTKVEFEVRFLLSSVIQICIQAKTHVPKVKIELMCVECLISSSTWLLNDSHRDIVVVVTHTIRAQWYAPW